MGWSAAGDFNPMTQFMANGMLNFQNPMGTSIKYGISRIKLISLGMPGIPGMTMDPMAQGMFGGYGMNMNGMSSGMMGMGFDAGQGMYGGWDGSQSNMWNGGQDKFNPNAFANGMGPQYGGPSGFGGFNMSQPNGFPNQNYQNGYYGPGYSRGNFRGRGRGFYYGGRGRGGFMAQGQGHTNFSHNANSPTLQNQNNFNQEPQSQEGAADEAPPADQEVATKPDGEAGPDDEQAGSAAADTTNADEMSAQGQPADVPSTEAMQGDESQLHGIPTVDTFQQPNAMGFMPMGHAAMSGPMGMGYGRAGYMRGGYGGGGRGGFGPFTPGPGPNMPPPNPGVEGAPAAPRAMREGLPNTSVFRHRGYQPQARGSLPAVKPVDGSQTYVLPCIRPTNSS